MHFLIERFSACSEFVLCKPISQGRRAMRFSFRAGREVTAPQTMAELIKTPSWRRTGSLSVPLSGNRSHGVASHRHACIQKWR